MAERPGTPLILKHASVSRPSGQWRDDDYDVLEDGVVVGRIFCLDAVGPQGRPWMWASGHNGDIRHAAGRRAPARQRATRLRVRRRWHVVGGGSSGAARP